MPKPSRARTSRARPRTLDRAPARRAALLAAAQRCFWRNGIRRTAMDDVAREANLAKGTVYLYFASKEDLFANLVSEMCRDALAGVRAALGAPGSVAGRLARAIDAKLSYFRRVLAGSPHTAELLESRAALAEQSFQELDLAFRDALATALAGERLGLRAKERDELLEQILDASYGAAHRADLRGEPPAPDRIARVERHVELLLEAARTRRA